MVLRFKFASSTTEENKHTWFSHIVWFVYTGFISLASITLASKHRHTKNHTSTIVSPQSAFNSLIAILNTYLVCCWSHGIQSCNLLLSCCISFYRDIVSWFIYCYVIYMYNLIIQLIEKLYLR